MQTKELRRWVAGATIVVTSIFACGRESIPVARDASVVQRLAPTLADAKAADPRGHLLEAAPRILASADFTQPGVASAWKIRPDATVLVEKGPNGLVLEPEPGGIDVILGFTPPVALPPAFRVELRVAWTRGIGAMVADRLLWRSRTHPEFDLFRHVGFAPNDPPKGGMVRGIYDVRYWPGEIEELRFDFVRVPNRQKGSRVIVQGITIMSDPARTTRRDDGGRVWADLGGTVHPVLTSAVPSRLTIRSRVPRSGRFSAELGLVGAETETQSSFAGFSIRVGGVERPVASARLAPDAFGNAGWVRLTADLADWADQEVELHLEVDGSELPPTATALWGMPAVLGARADPSPPPVVVVAVWDTVRQESLSVYGYDRPTTPFLERLAERAAVFEAAFSQSAWTIPSMASMLTSRYPWQLGVQWGAYHRLPEGPATIAEAFAKEGFVTGAFVSNFVLGAGDGYARGFDSYQPAAFEMTDGDLITEQALRWAARHPDMPLFLLVHYTDPHAPYAPTDDDLRALYPELPEDELSGPSDPSYENANPENALRMQRRYEAEIRAADRYLERLVRGLESLRGGREPLLVLASDHGEDFLEHGFLSHGAHLFASQVHVPLILSWPGHVPARRIQSVVRNLDIAPTLLDLVGSQIPEGFEGVSLKPLLEGQPATLSAYSETNLSGPRRMAIREDGFTYATFERGNTLTPPHPAADREVRARLDARLPATALYDGLGGGTGPDRSSGHGERVQRLQRRLDEVEVRRQRGWGIQFRAPAALEREGTVALSGELTRASGSFLAPRTHGFEAESDVAEMDASNRRIRFRVTLTPGDTDWIFVDEDSSDDIALTVESDSSSGVVTLVCNEASAQVDRIAIGRAAAACSPEVVLSSLETSESKAAVRIWASAEGSPGIAPSDDEDDQMSRLRALGYIE